MGTCRQAKGAGELLELEVELQLEAVASVCVCVCVCSLGHRWKKILANQLKDICEYCWPCKLQIRPKRLETKRIVANNE